MPSKRRRRPVASDRRLRHNRTPAAADFGPAERWQHSGRTLALTETAGLLAARATEEHIIDRLALRGWIDKIQSEAAFKFKLDYQRASLSAHVTGRYAPDAGARDFLAALHERTDFEEAAYRRWRHAVRELGLLLSGVVISVVCHDLAPVPRDLARLQKGLSKLADWYGLGEKKTPAKPVPSDPNASGQNIDQASPR